MSLTWLAKHGSTFPNMKNTYHPNGDMFVPTMDWTKQAL